MKRIYQKLAAAASAAIGFVGLATAPAKAATFAMGSTDDQFPLYIKFSGTLNFSGENEGSMGLDGLDKFQAIYGGTATWEKKDLVSFLFVQNPNTVYLDPQLPPPGFSLAPLDFEAINERGEKLKMIMPSGGYTTVTIPQDCPPFAPPNTFCGSYTYFRTGARSVRQIADDPTSVPVPEPTVIPGLILGIGWLIKKKQASSVKVDS